MTTESWELGPNPSGCKTFSSLRAYPLHLHHFNTVSGFAMKPACVATSHVLFKPSSNER